MPERDGYIAGVPCWVDTNQPDPEAAAAFYGELFGWTVEDVMPPGSPVKYFIGRIRGGDVAGVGPVPEGAPSTATWNTYIWVDSADETAAKVKDAGGEVVMEPMDVMEEGRAGVFRDPEGAAFCVWQAKRHKGSQIVNEAGSVNFNTLSTHDVEAAKAFYGQVFGWRTLSLPSGEMWTLPGYGDYLERDRPGLREQTVAFGAPAEFVDVVASLNPLSDEQPAHWSVTFATDDADATARRAVELGGKVVMAPFDAPWVRMTVLADPQGATFMASQFVPENRDLPSRSASASAAA
jgi:predicted enzyme related to lactoylglutathione lyase